MKATRLVTATVFCLCLMSVGFAGRDDEQNDRIQIAPSDFISAESVKVINKDEAFHLQYSLTNKSAEALSALTVTLTGYDVKGNIAGRETWLVRRAVPAGAKTSSNLDMELNMSSVTKLKVEFVPVSLTQGGLGCEPSSFCNQCFMDAKAVCGPHGVYSLSCTTGETCRCSYNCGHP